ncbi:MAG: preprotein translocase subunit YajC [Gammaproteobacteria bacterium]|nr:preprotein translocase subunit YajC [Gammaproteobacteria bacterium]|tara:strand:- start:83 stop:418 length:336 start_codon:yes stop_codon:yes gene_type:complete
MFENLIPLANATDAAPNQAGGFPLDLFIIIAFALVFYFIVWRPQSKRNKEHRELVSGLEKGDEIITGGGLVGRIVKVEDQFIVLEAGDGVELKLQKSAVVQALPKGTIKNI